MTTGGHGCNSTLLAGFITVANFRARQVAGSRMLPCMTPPRGAGRRLSVDDWIQAGFAILADGGPNALRVDRLCERLGVTKGSFYWHFTDLHAYRTALRRGLGQPAGSGSPAVRELGRRRAPRTPEIHDAAVVGAPAVGARAGHARVGTDRRRPWPRMCEEATAGCFGRCTRPSSTPASNPQDAGVRSAVFFGAGMGVLHGSESRRTHRSRCRSDSSISCSGPSPTA